MTTVARLARKLERLETEVVVPLERKVVYLEKRLTCLENQLKEGGICQVPERQRK